MEPIPNSDNAAKLDSLAGKRKAVFHDGTNLVTRLQELYKEFLKRSDYEEEWADIPDESELEVELLVVGGDYERQRMLESELHSIESDRKGRQEILGKFESLFTVRGTVYLTIQGHEDHFQQRILEGIIDNIKNLTFNELEALLRCESSLAPRYYSTESKPWQEWQFDPHKTPPPIPFFREEGDSDSEPF